MMHTKHILDSRLVLLKFPENNHQIVLEKLLSWDAGASQSVELLTLGRGLGCELAVGGIEAHVGL